MGGTQHRYHLGVGGYLRSHAEALGHHQVGVVVDITVEYRGDQRDYHAIGPDGIHRMGVGLGDQAHAGPPGVSQDRPLHAGGDQSPGQKAVGGQRRT